METPRSQCGAHPECVKVMEFAAGPRIRGMARTPDGKSLVFGNHDASSDIVLIGLAR
jgi:hypothetical protein